MKTYKLTIKLISPTLPGSGEGWGGVIDTDIVFDEMGLPFFPARRLKGALRESAKEVIEMLDKAQINPFSSDIIDEAFGKPGSIDASSLIFENLHISEYTRVLNWCRWAIEKGLLSTESVLDVFTELRQQTSINKYGVAEENSLRTSRVLKPGITFLGYVFLRNERKDILKLLTLSCCNLRHLGSMRHRGYGEVECCLYEDEKSLSEQFIAELRKEVAR